MRQRLTVVACSGRKLGRAAPAADLYQGALFRKARAVAEAEGGPWIILSARHGAILPDEYLEPYEERLPTKRAVLARWDRETAAQLRALAILIPGPRPVLFLAGARYAQPTILHALRRFWGPTLQPLAGLGIGRQLRQLALNLPPEGDE